MPIFLVIVIVIVNYPTLLGTILALLSFQYILFYRTFFITHNYRVCK